MWNEGIHRFKMFSGFALDQDKYVPLLEKLIGFTEKLQNNPPELVPQEGLIADTIVEFLKPVTAPNGPIKVTKYTYVEGRPNLVLEYMAPEPTKKVISFVGAHMDVVPANPSLWEFDPFSLSKADGGERLQGRGVTDCLGHVALLACLFEELGRKAPKLNANVKAVCIASEENSTIPGVGIEEMQARGDLQKLELEHGPLLWIDSANFGPTMGTAGAVTWELKVSGKPFHSGLPHKAINAIELASQVMSVVQSKFHEKYAFSDKEKQYKFAIGSSMKPTQISVPSGGLNQIPGHCTVRGDVRLTPFHDMKEVQASIESWVKEIDVATLPSFGYGTYTLPEENKVGALELTWMDEPFLGVACDLESIGFKALHKAVTEVHGKDCSYSITGSLPLIADLKQLGFDVQITGFGRMEAYHAVNEFGMLSEFKQGYQILLRVIDAVHAQ